jgi:hypothetical protein
MLEFTCITFKLKSLTGKDWLEDIGTDRRNIMKGCGLGSSGSG